MIVYVRLDWKTLPASGCAETTCYRSAGCSLTGHQAFEDPYMFQELEMQDYVPAKHPDQTKASMPNLVVCEPPESGVEGGGPKIITDGDEVSMMMRGIAGRKWPGGAGDDGSRSRTPRKQKQPHGTTNRRRRLIARSRNIRQRLAEKKAIYHKDAWKPRDREGLAKGMRDVFKRRPAHPREYGFANRELQVFERALRNDGALGMALTVSSILQVFARMLLDLSALFEVIAIDLVEPHQNVPFEPVPQVDEDVPSDMEAVEVESPHRCDASASSGQPPRRRRADPPRRRRQHDPAAGGFPRDREPGRHRPAVRGGSPPEVPHARPLPGGVPPWRQHRGPDAGGRGGVAELHREDEEWEVEEENDDDDEDEDPVDEDAHHNESRDMDDEHALAQKGVQNGKQLGLLRRDVANDLIVRIMDNVRSAGHLPSRILKQLRRAVTSKLPGVRLFANEVLNKLKSQKVTWMSGPSPTWWRTLWSMVRNKVRQASKSRSWKLRASEDVLELMQRSLDLRPAQMPSELAFHPEDRYWFAKMLQRDMVLQTQLHGSISAGAMQLDSWLMRLVDIQPPCILDVVQMCSAVVIAVDNVDGQLPDAGEERVDAIDAWVASWQRRITSWLRVLSMAAEPVVVVEDSLDEGVVALERMEAETAYVQEITALQHEMWRSMQRRSARQQKQREMEARTAQAWEDWVMNDAMESPTAATRTRRNQAVQTECSGDRDADEADGAAKRRRVAEGPAGLGVQQRGDHDSCGSERKAKSPGDEPTLPAAGLSPQGTGGGNDLDGGAGAQDGHVQEHEHGCCGGPHHAELDGDRAAEHAGGAPLTIEHEFVNETVGPLGEDKCHGQEGIEATVPDNEEYEGNK